MSTVLVPETFTVTYTTEVFSPPLAGPITSVTALLTGTGTNVVSITVPLGAASVTTSLQPDTYTWTMTNSDSAGNTYGGPYTGSFVVTSPKTVTLSLASALALS